MSESGDVQSEETFVISFDDAKATNRALVGGKGANLARLVGAGLPVPDGFCVTTAAYEALIDEPAIRDAINDLATLDSTDTAAIADAGSALRTRIQERDVPEEIRDAIESALDENASDPEQPYAVRSSATAEDLPEASFAGQQETFLNIRGADAIINRVQACMASLFTDRAIAYRATNDIPHEEVAIAVVVQRMVTSDVSGILFTADPQTGNRHITAIDAVSGLSEALVSGDVSGDTVQIDRRTGEILDYETGDQRIVVRSRSEGGTETVELTPSDPRNRLLTETQLHTLTDLGSEIESLFGCPQDIEWCLSDDLIFIVQSRPITSLFPVPTPQPTDDRLHVYYSMGHAQAFAEAMPPMAMNIWISLINSTMAAMGLDPTTKWGVEAGGRIYIDTTPLLRVGFIRRRISESISAMSEADGAAFEALLSRHGEEFQTERTTWETIASLPRFATTHWGGARQTVTLTIWACRGGSVNLSTHSIPRRIDVTSCLWYRRSGG